MLNFKFEVLKLLKKNWNKNNYSYIKKKKNYEKIKKTKYLILHLFRWQTSITKFRHKLPQALQRDCYWRMGQFILYWTQEQTQRPQAFTHFT